MMGQSYALSDAGASADALINLYSEVIESQQGKNVARWVGKPGITLFATLATGPVRCLWTGEGRLLAIAGGYLYEIFGDSTSKQYGAVYEPNAAALNPIAAALPAGTGFLKYATDIKSPSQLFPNGQELLIVSSGYAWRVYGDSQGYHVVHIKLTAATYTDLAIGVKAFYADIAIDPAISNKITSLNRPFDPQGDIGLWIQIQGLNGFTAGQYQLVNINSAGAALLNTSPGPVGSINGVGQLLDGTNTTVNSPSLPFQASDLGNTLVITGGPGFGPGSYTIVSVNSATGAATLSTAPGGAGSLEGQATQYPGEGLATDAAGNLKAGTGAVQDGYGIVAPPIDPTQLCNKFYISDPTTGSFANWSAIDVGLKEGYPDNILALFSDHEQLSIFGDLQSVETWTDTGASNFPFERNPGAFLTHGLVAQWSVTQLGMNGIAWIGWSAGRGSPQAFSSVSGQPQRISTNAIERIWQGYITVRDAVAYNYIEDGHQFYVVHFPTGDATWVYDLATQLWHQRSWWDGSKHHRERQSCHAYGWLMALGPAWVQNELHHFVGDWSNGNIYVQGLYYNQDNAGAIVRQRVFPHVANEANRTYHWRFQLECEVGAGMDLNPVLDYSRDNGWNYINPKSRIAHGSGKRNQRLIWWRCGMSRDQVWRLTISDNAPVSITNAYFQDSAGIS